MSYLFIDESGELGTHPNSSRHFVIAAISITDKLPLERKIKRLNAALYRAGWPKDVEIKGSNVWGCVSKKELIDRVPAKIKRDRIGIIERYINAVHSSGCRIAYSVALKRRLSPRIMSANYGIAFNYLCGQLVVRYYHRNLNCNVLRVWLDQRNKETHNQRHFDGYLETRFFEECVDCETISIRHDESHLVRGLQAVDFISWGLFRYYEHNDRQFRDAVYRGNVFKDNWYAR